MMRPQDNMVRLELIQNHTHEMTLNKDVDLNRIVELTEEFHQSHLALICEEAEMVSKVETFNSMYSSDILNFDKIDHIVVFYRHFIIAIDIIKHRSGNILKYQSHERVKKS